MLDDAVALIAALREETGARPLILMDNLSFRALASDWDTRESLSTVRAHPFDERPGPWAELKNGRDVLLW